MCAADPASMHHLFLYHAWGGRGVRAPTLCAHALWACAVRHAPCLPLQLPCVCMHPHASSCIDAATSLQSMPSCMSRITACTASTTVPLIECHSLNATPASVRAAPQSASYPFPDQHAGTLAAMDAPLDITADHALLPSPHVIAPMGVHEGQAGQPLPPVLGGGAMSDGAGGVWEFYNASSAVERYGRMTSLLAR